MMKFIDRIEKSKYLWSICIILFIFFLLRFPSLFEPYWYGDEGITQIVGVGMRTGHLLYRDIWDNKPPLLYLIYAFFNADQFSIHAASLAIGLATVFAFFSFSKLLFNEKKIVILTTIIFASLFGLPIIEGNIANAENFMLLPTLITAILFYNVLQKKSKKNKKVFFLCGLLLGLSFLIKVVALFDFLAFSTFYLFVLFGTSNKKDFKNILFKERIYILSFVSGFILPYTITALFFLFHGALGIFIDSTLKGNLSYLAWKNTFIFSQGLIILKLVMLILFLILLFKKRKFFEKHTLFILIWLSFSLFNAFFSQRPYTHYLLVLLPSFSLLISYIFLEQQVWKRIITIVCTCFLIFLSLTQFEHWDIVRTGMYYKNFMDFILQKKDFTAYQNFFDNRNIRDYTIADYLRKHTHPKDTVFIWSNSAQIYVLSDTLPAGRYSVAYHILMKDAIRETEAAINKTKPKYIIITPDENYNSFIPEGYMYTLTVEGTDIYERIL